MVSQHCCQLKLLVLCQFGHPSVGLVVLPHYPGTDVSVHASMWSYALANPIPNQ